MRLVVKTLIVTLFLLKVPVAVGIILMAKSEMTSVAVESSTVMPMDGNSSALIV